MSKTTHSDVTAQNKQAAVYTRHPKSILLAAIWSGLLATALLPLGNSAQADIGATHTTIVSEFASFNTPGVVDGRVEAIAVDGDTVFVGGTFTQIQEPLSDEIIDQPYLFAYSKSTGNIIREFDPVLNNVVLALETTGEGTGVFAGGVFNIINGESNRRGIVKIDDNGDRVSGFGARTDALVKTLVRHDNTLYIGGNFDRIGATPADKLVAIDTTSGAVLPNLDLDFGGLLTNSRNVTRVQGVDDIDITSDGRLMVIIGNWETIDGISRPRLALIELEGQARVSDWNTNIFDDHCPANLFVQYIKGIDIAPDDSYFVTGSSGFRRAGNPACDSVVRFEIDDLTNDDVQPTWVNYTGGDSVYDVVATDHAIYAGGHFRWMTNDTSTNGRNQGAGSQERRGLAALDPLNGLTLIDWRSDRNPRGVGVFAMIAEEEGLYLGDDTDFINGTEHKKLKFLPVTEDTIVRPDVASLPTTILSPNGNALQATAFDGASLGAPAELSNTGWQDARGGMFVGGQLFHSDNNGTMWMSRFTDDAFEPRVPVDLFGLNTNYWGLNRIGGMFFDHEWSRVYYTIQGDSRLFYRGFTPDGPYFGNEPRVAEQSGDIFWGDVSGMDVIDGHLYFARNDGTLYRAEIDGAAVVSGTTVALSGPGIDGRNWSNTMLAFLNEGISVGQRSSTQFEFQSSGTQTSGRFRTFEFPVAPGEPVVLRLDWQDPAAMLNLFVRDANGDTVASDNTAVGSPKFVTAPAGDGGTYTASVLIKEGSTAYTLQVNPEDGPPAPAEPLADFEFSSSGSTAAGRFQRFDFPVVAGELVESQVIWDDAAANVRVFLRDETGTPIVRDINSIGSALVSTFAETSGNWSMAILVNHDTTVNYDVLIDTTAGVTPPAPLADFVFNSVGSQDSGRFQRFNFDVVAGQEIDAQVYWDDMNADVRVFLRDASGAPIDRDIVGNGLGAVSAVATISGQWSVAVFVLEETDVEYEVLINTD